jgi:hypothetical protein
MCHGRGDIPRSCQDGVEAGAAASIRRGQLDIIEASVVEEGPEASQITVLEDELDLVAKVEMHRAAR